MKKSILVKGPVLSRSGYGYQARFALKALRSREDLFDIYIQNIPWGRTGWIHEDDEFRRWMDKRIIKTIEHGNSGGNIDMSLQITIPNEWEKISSVNIGYTAGIESSKVAPVWLQKGNDMDRIIVVSNHARNSYQNTVAQAQEPQTGKIFDYRLQTPIDVVNYSVLNSDQSPIEGFDIETDFNFLVVAQAGPRKNIVNTIRWWVEEFKNDENVGLIVKANTVNDSLTDYKHTKGALYSMLSDHKDKKCKVYLLHGALSREQMSWLYLHDKVKASINIAHGEGFGLPIFEAAYHGLPNITIAWSGQLDYLVQNGKKYFVDVLYTFQPIQKEAHWPGVLESDSFWAFAEEDSYKQQCRNLYDNYEKWKELAEELRDDYILKKFTEEKIYDLFVKSIIGDQVQIDGEVDRLFAEISAV